MASSSHLKPGEKGKLTAKVDTNNRAGVIVKHVEVYTNDPARPKIVLSLKADIKAKEQPPLPPKQKPVTQ